MRRNRVPKRGEIWLVDLGMAEKVRPALVLSGPCGATDRNIITVIPHTTTLAARVLKSTYRCHASTGAFLAQSPATVPAPRAEKFLGRMTEAQIRQVEDALLEWLAIRRQDSTESRSCRSGE